MKAQPAEEKIPLAPDTILTRRTLGPLAPDCANQCRGWQRDDVHEAYPIVKGFMGSQVFSGTTLS